MKKQKLALRKETIRPLQTNMLGNVVGGTGVDCRVIGSNGACTSSVSIILSRCGIELTAGCVQPTVLACGSFTTGGSLTSG